MLPTSRSDVSSWFTNTQRLWTASGSSPDASRGLVGHASDTIGVNPSRGIRSHSRSVHGPRCLPSNRPHLWKAIDSRHCPVLMLLDAFHSDVDARNSFGVVLVLARPTLEPFFVAVRSLRISTHETLLTRVLRVNPRRWHALKSCFVRGVVLESTERQVKQASVHPRVVGDTIAYLFEAQRRCPASRTVGSTPRCAETVCGVGHGRTVPRTLRACRVCCPSPRSVRASES